MSTLKVFQVYFKEEQLNDLAFIPFLNKKCTPYFENKIIVDLIESGEHKDCTHFGVLSHKFESKIKERMSGDWDLLPNLKNHHRLVMGPNQIAHALSLFDLPVLSLMQHPAHDPITYGANFHKKLPTFFKKILKKIGFEWRPEVFERVYYSNYFIARPDIYEDYVTTMLGPAIQVMEDMPDLWQDSGYAFDLSEDLKKEWGVNHYPYHSFVLERLFSYYCHLNKDKIWTKQK